MKTNLHNNIARITLYTSIVLYGASLTQECYCTTGACGDHWSGISIVALGAIGGIMSLAGLTWYANPLLWMAWSQIKTRPKKTLFFSLGATLVSAAFLLCNEITDVKPGRTTFITEYRLGYWLWLASTMAMLIGSFIAFIIQKDDVTDQNQLQPF